MPKNKKNATALWGKREFLVAWQANGTIKTWVDFRAAMIAAASADCGADLTEKSLLARLASFERYLKKEGYAPPARPMRPRKEAAPTETVGDLARELGLPMAAKLID
jgi:hypothetical protein